MKPLLAKGFSFAALLFCLLCLMPKAVQAQQQKPQPRNWAAVWDWAAASWNKDDKPYQQMRAEIDKAVATGQNPQELTNAYEVPARKMPDDPKAQFRWAYAALVAAKQADDAVGERILGKPREALILAPFPNTYEYARLIFLTEDYIGMPIPKLQKAGERVLKRNPKDIATKYAVARNLIYSPNPADRVLADRYIQELIVTKPQ